MWLRVMTGADAGRIVEVRGPRFTVGRDPDCDLVLRDEGVAERHAVFEEREEGWMVLEDLGSERGTFVATRRISGPTWVSGHEELCFGDTFAQLGLTRRELQPRRPRALVGTILVLVGLAAVGFGVLIATAGSDEDPPAALETTVTVSVAQPTGPGATTPAPTTDQSETGSAETAGAETAEAEPAEAAPAEAETLPFAGGGEDVLFADDFSDPGSGWEVFEGEAATAGYRDGRFVIAVADPSYYATSSSGKEVDEAVVNVTALNPERSREVGFGVLCRYRDEENFDLLAAGADGTAAILRREDGVLRVLSGGGSWVSSDAVPAGARRYELRAECRTDRLRLAVNGRRAVSVAVGGRPGQVGLFVAGPAEIRFDDLVATAPRG